MCCTYSNLYRSSAQALKNTRGPTAAGIMKINLYKKQINNIYNFLPVRMRKKLHNSLIHRHICQILAGNGNPKLTQHNAICRAPHIRNPLRARAQHSTNAPLGSGHPATGLPLLSLCLHLYLPTSLLTIFACLVLFV